jgi:5'/3'-nucleotidase SurE
VNDDGPPNQTTSPFILSLSAALLSAGHLVSVILPNQQRSWIGKAHFIDTKVVLASFCPTRVAPDGNDGAHVTPDKMSDAASWILVNSTPASCVQLGVYHCFQDRGPIDLVVSGPNLGRNSTTVFALSSGTIGAAMEAAICGKPAIALSFAHNAHRHDPAVIDEASRHSVRLIEHLYDAWPDDVDLYSINVPLEVGVSAQKIMHTCISKRRWPSGGAFSSTNAECRLVDPGNKHVGFEWSPRLDSLRTPLKGSDSRNDDWVIEQGMTR